MGTKTSPRSASAESSDQTLGVPRAQRSPADPRALPVRRDGIPCPDHAPAAHVERAHDARGIVRAHLIGDQRAEHRDLADDHRRRGRVVLPLGDALLDALAQCDAPGLAEVRAQLARVGVEREQLRIFRAVEQTAPARRARPCRGIFPVRQAAAVERIRSLGSARAQAGIEHPALLAGLGCEREHALEGSAVVQRVADHERVHLERRRRVVLRAGVEVAAAVLPDAARADPRWRA